MIEDYAIAQAGVGIVGLLVLMLVLLYLLGKIFTKSKEYRKLMADMFVVGKIKQIATEEKINLLEELKEFAKFMKNKAIDFEALDDTIERELQEKIANTTKEVQF